MNKILAFAALLLLAGCSQQPAEQELNVYNWSEYIPHELVQQFSQETGIKVNYATYESNEAMYAKIALLKGEGYDLVFPSTYFVAKMAKNQLLQPLDKSQLTQLENLDPALLDKPYDPGNRYSLPFMWGSAAIAVNSKVVAADAIDSWADLWQPRWQGQLQLSDDVRELFQIALTTLGHDGNSSDLQQIEQAYGQLQKLMPNVRAFNSDAQHAAFLNGDINVGVIWNAEAYKAQQELPELRYIYPREGAIFWIDCMAIPVGAKNVSAAHKFIDFLLRPDIAKRMVEESGYATPNRKGRELLDEALRNNPVIFPPAEILANGQFQLDISEEASAAYERYFELLKVGAQ